MVTGGIIDCDVHHGWNTQEELLPYLSRGWQEYVKGPGRAGLIPFSPGGYMNPHGFNREDAYPDSGRLPGCDVEALKTALLDEYDIERAILTHQDGLFIDRQRNPYFAAEIVRAANDWTIDQWLPRDPRFYGSILVSNQIPELAAQEIRRLGNHPRMVQVLMSANAVGRPLGHPIFHTIYEAAAEHGLPVTIHSGGDVGLGAASSAGGTAALYIEYHTLNIESMMTHLVTFITNGVFEKYAPLKLVLTEGGTAWVPALLWRFDSNYKGLRREVPWVKRLPSEYFYDHIRLSTQPLEDSPKREQLIHILECYRADDILLFASDYPHWDADEVTSVRSRLPKSWLPKIFRENALKVFRWPA